ncbi:uncharacterized protein LOC110039045 [Phalaenopsis equestris]|uniref:uncharacterized protein LOC110039045 n=1 Tax=Phalaenopsis equestris TaxID=78828 RepID=UPI0009E299D0|nr:uncharacterized protein LOC110039045 [Phalaenopsis equestris]
MKPNRRHSFASQTFFFISFLLVFCLGNDKFLISTIKKNAFEAMDVSLTDVEYKVPLQGNLTSVQASAMLIRNRTFWLKGANLSSFHLPPGIISNSFSRRVLLISYNLGHNLSNSLYTSSVESGFSLISPVVGLLAYDGGDATHSNRRELGFTLTGELIVIKIPAWENRAVSYCARFGKRGYFSLEGEELNGCCLTKGPGSFGVVAKGLIGELPAAAPPPPAADAREKRWRMWMVGLGGAGSLALVSWMAIWVGSLVARRRVREMRKEADEGQVLDVMWIGGRKIPVAGLTRTVPVL